MKTSKVLLSLVFLLFASSPVFAQYCPVNIDFETGGTGNWEFFRGSVTIGPVYSFSSCPPVKGLHTLTSGADTDYYGGFPIVGDGMYSLKLGHDTALNNADRARYNIHIPGGGTIYNLIYRYAAVFEDGGHSTIEQPRMEIKAFDSSTGLLIGCDSVCFVASKTLFGFTLSPKSVPGDQIYYRPWTAGNMNFQGWGGHTITVEFTINSCTAGGHFGYGYIDMGCGLFASRVISCLTPTVTLNGPAGYESYRWCDSTSLGTTIDTTQNLTISTPGIPTTYALIVVPPPGYGCPDTLYTQVIPITPCSAAPAPGSAYATRATVCGDPDTLVVRGYSMSCGLAFQWQYSVDGTTWVNIPGANRTVWPYSNPYLSLYYRCVATCSTTGLSAGSAPVFVPAVSGVGMSSVTVPPDTICRGAEFYVSACGTSTTYSVASFYGDGTTDTFALSTSGLRHVDIYHNYPFPGVYFIKQILYDGSAAVDSVSFSYSYYYCSTLPINFFYDVNGNCINDNDEANFITVTTEVDSNGVPIDTISATSGFRYLAMGVPGTIYTFRIINYPSSIIVSCPLSGTISDTIKSLVNMYMPKSFGLSCGTPDFDLVAHATRPRVGLHRQRGNIYVHNNRLCPFPLVAGLTLDISPKFTEIHIINSTPSVTYVSGTSAQWTFAMLDSRPVNISYDILTKSSLEERDTVLSMIALYPKAGDSDTTNNTETSIDTAKSSNDPNFIDVNPARCLSSGITANDLRYTIAFENTGNDTAHNIHIMDTLSDNLDPRTLQLVDASAQMNIALFNVDGHNIVKFDFPGINLLDSSHHGFCDGMVMYNIKTRAGLADGTSIQNHAGIFFDINPVVLTNTVENIIGCAALGIKNTEKTFNVELYPNPAKDELTINIDRDAYSSFTITNQVGQVLVQKNITAQQTRIDTKAFAAGLYYITLKGDNGTIVRKFVKI
ncbi:MAG: C-terminal target protein [Flavipsychrobacter sp.]|nr:C-terminal target protein [Flavipsychrobacter sp.]